MLLSHGSRLAHMLVVEHVVCEHGDLLDAEHGSSEPEATHEHEPAVHEQSTGETDHEHCDAATILHRVDAVDPLVGDALLLSAAPAAIPAGDEVRAVTQLELAPKVSPPQA